MSVHAMPEPVPVDAARPGIGILRLIDQAIGLLAEIPAALLVMSEIVVLLLGVVSRYVFHKPLLWTDELAATQFIWLAMLGAVIALRRAEHMRMTAFVSAASPAWRRYFDALALAVSIGFLAFMLEPSIEFALEEVPITTPALEISNAWHAGALPHTRELTWF